MSVTFNNDTFTNTDAAVGAIADVNTGLLGLRVTALVGTSLTSSIGVTTVTVNGTIGAPGSTANVSLNAAGIALNDPTSTYVGYSQDANGNNTYYFSVAGTNTITGQLLTVGVGVSAEGVPSLLGTGVNLQAITTTAVTAPADPALQNGGTFGAPVFQSATANGNTVTLAYNENLSTTAPLPGSFAVSVNGTAAAVAGATVSGSNVVLTLATPIANGQTVTVGYTDPTINDDANAIQDIAGNDAPSLLLAAATNNTPQAPGPVLQSATANGNTVTLAYNEALSTTGPIPGSYQVTVDGTAATVTGANVSGQTVVLTLATPVANGQTVTVGYTDPTTGNDIFAVQDLVGNDAASTSSPVTATNITAQAAGPVLQSATANGNTVALAYNEALSLVGPLTGSFQVSVDGTAATVTGAAVLGQTVSLTLATPVANGQTVTVGYTDPTANNDFNAVQDLVGNDAASSAPITATNATPQAAGPVLQSATADGNTVTLAYNEALSLVGPLPGAFQVSVDGNAATVTSATALGQSVVLTLANPVANGQVVTVGYTDPSANNDVNAVQDLVGNDAASSAPIIATNATPQAAGPVLQSATADGNTVTLAYSEALSLVGPLPGSFQVSVDGTAAVVAAAAVAGQTVVLTLASPVANGQIVTVGYTDPTANNDVAAVQDLVGNDAASSAPITATNATPQAPGPVLQSATADGNTVTLAYNEILSPVGPLTGSFQVSVGGTTATVDTAAVSGQTVVLTLANPVANGQVVTVGYTDPTVDNDIAAVQDLVGNDAASEAPITATNATPQAAGPVLQSATANGDTVTLAYSEALSLVGPLPGSFQVSVDGTAAVVAAAAVAGQSVVLTLATPVANGQTVTVGYTDPTANNDINAVQDLVGNDAASSAPITATNATAQAPGPVLQSATADGNTVTLTYDEALSPVGPLTGSFTVTVDGTAAAVDTAAVSGQSIVLTLANPVANGQAVTVDYADPTANNDLFAVQDSFGNDAATATITATNNTAAIPGPAFQSATADGDTVTLAYNEVLDAADPPPTSAFVVAVDGTPATITGADVVGQTVVLTLATPVNNGQAVTVGYTDPSGGNDTNAIQDLAGNDAASVPATTAAINATPQATGPVLQSATADGSTVTLAYNEALSPNGPLTGSFLVEANGTAAAVTNADVVGQTVVLTLATPVANGQIVTVTYTDPTAGNDAAAVQDEAGNDAATATITASNGTPQAQGPVLQAATADGNSVTLAYDEALSSAGPLPASFEVSVGGTDVAVSNAAVSGSNVVLTLATPVNNGQAVTVTYTDPSANNDPAAVQDPVGNDAATATIAASNITPQAPGPVFQSATANGSTVTLAYDQTLSPIGPLPGSFQVAVNGTAATVTGAAVVGQSLVLTLATPVANGQTVTVGYTDPTANNDPNAIQDLAGNDAASLSATTGAANATPQGTGPVLQSATANGNSVTLAYDEALSLVGPLPGSFEVSVDGTDTTVSNAAVSGQTVVLTLATPVNNGQAVTVTYTDPSANNDPVAVQDLVGNDAATATVTASNTTPQAPGPVFQSATAYGSTVTLAYDEILNPVGPLTGSFQVAVNGTAATVTGADVVGQTVVLTLATPVANGQTVTVGYTDPTANNDPNAIQDLAGNDAASLPATTGAANATPQGTGPVLQSATANGNTVTLAYDEALSLVGPLPGSFEVSVDGTAATVSTAAVSGQNVVLTLATPVNNGQAVTVTYTDPSANNDPNAVQDLVGNDAATATINASNTTPQAPGPVFQSATADGNTVTLAYDQALSPVGPLTGSFAVTAGGATDVVTGAAVSGSNVVLTLANPVTSAQTVTVGYMDPTGNNDPSAIQDLAGNDAATLSPVTAANATAQVPGPVFQSATADGNTVTLAYGAALSPNGPLASAFAVTADGTADAVIGAAVSGQSVVLTLATPVNNGQAVTVGYTDPTTGNDANAIQDLAGNDAATLAPTGVVNATPQAPGPAFQSASADGNTVTLAYNEALNPNGPPAGAFAVTAGGAPVAVTGAAVSGQSVVLTLATPVNNGQAVTVGYTDPTAGNDANAVQDLAGNDAATLAPTGVVNATPQAPGPAFQSASADGAVVTLAYNEALNPNGPPAGAFAVTAGGTADSVTGAAVSGQNIVLTLATPVSNGQAVTVGYTDPTAGNDANAIQDLAGNDAASLPTMAVTNATPIVIATSPGTEAGGTGTDTTGESTGTDTGSTGTNPSGGSASPLGAGTSITVPSGSAVAYGTGAAAGDIISIDPSAAHVGRGEFVITGHVASNSGVTSVAISAVIDEGDVTVLGDAAVASDGSYTFVDHVGPHLQGFITATETDGAGDTTSVQSPFSLQGGLAGTGAGMTAQQVLFSPDGSAIIGSSNYHANGTVTVDVQSSSQIFESHYYETFRNHGAPDNTFVFNPGFGEDRINQFRLGGDDHDTISLPSADFANLADVFRNTYNTAGGATIVDPASGDTLKLTGITKAELKANPSDFTFHP